MARLVKRDTYVYEDAGAGNYVRRQAFAGQHVPDHYVEGELDGDGNFTEKSSGAIEEVEAQRGPGLGAGASEYGFNRGVTVQEQLKRRNLDSSDEAAEAVAAGGQARVNYEREQREKSSRSAKATGGQVGNDETEVTPSATPDAGQE